MKLSISIRSYLIFIQEHLDCPEMIEEFEERREKERLDKENEDSRPKGFDRNLEPERIIGKQSVTLEKRDVS